MFLARMLLAPSALKNVKRLFCWVWGVLPHCLSRRVSVVFRGYGRRLSVIVVRVERWGVGVRMWGVGSGCGVQCSGVGVVVRVWGLGIWVKGERWGR
jgi:hypothetical protein